MFVVIFSLTVLSIFEQISIGVRRTQKRVNGRPLTYQGVSVLAYHELAFGRSKNVSGWENEIRIRCTRTNHIQMKNIEEKIEIRDGKTHYVLDYPDDDTTYKLTAEPDENFYTALEHHLKLQLSEIMPKEAKPRHLNSFAIDVMNGPYLVVVEHFQ